MGYREEVLKARRDSLLLIQKSEREIIEIYNAAARDIKRKIRNAKDGTATRTYLEELDKAIDKYRKDLYEGLSKSINKNHEKMKDIIIDGQVSFWDDVLKGFDKGIALNIKNKFFNVADRALGAILSGAIYGDNKSLDKRLWKLVDDNIKSIKKLIQINIVEGANARTLARQLDKFIDDKNILKSKRQVIKVYDPKTKKYKLKLQPLPDRMPTSISYQARRLARTSLTHVAHSITIESAKENPFCKGVKWNLSAAHGSRMGKKTCECEGFAKEDHFGLGPGVYKPGRTPLSHPNCLCYLTELVDVKEAREELKRWLQGEQNERLDKLIA